MRKLIICFTLAVLWGVIATAQKVYTINYSADTTLNPDCIFNEGPLSVQEFLHEPSMGKVFYSPGEKALMLGSQNGDIDNQEERKVSEYAIRVLFKKRFNYKVTAQVKTSAIRTAYKTTLWYKASFTKGLSMGCSTPPSTININWFNQNAYGYN